jgi:hypothetical protein
MPLDETPTDVLVLPNSVTIMRVSDSFPSVVGVLSTLFFFYEWITIFQ